MATIEQRTGKDGQLVYRVKVRRKGAPPLTATFPRLTEAKKWAQITEGAVLEGRHFPTTEAKWHTVNEMIARYRSDILPGKHPSRVVKIFKHGFLQGIPPSSHSLPYF